MACVDSTDGRRLAEALALPVLDQFHRRAVDLRDHLHETGAYDVDVARLIPLVEDGLAGAIGHTLHLPEHRVELLLAETAENRNLVEDRHHILDIQQRQVCSGV